MSGLRNLPYEEQGYWKSFNEEPKGRISKRAMKTDFEGCWDFEYDALNELKRVLQDLHQDRVPWWTLISEKLLSQTHYPVTGAPDEWGDEILHFDQLVVDGFETKWLRNQAQTLGKYDPLFQSQKLAEQCLIGRGHTDEDAKKIMSPLREAHDIRNKVKGHASGTESTAIKQRILLEHGSYRSHFTSLCTVCVESMRTITEAFKTLS
jgi:hypothetical protein